MSEIQVGNFDKVAKQYKAAFNDGIEALIKAVKKRQLVKAIEKRDDYLPLPHIDMSVDLADILEIAEELKKK